MILPPRAKPPPGPPKPVPAPVPEPPKSPETGLAAEQLVALAKHLKPSVTVQAAPRLDEWVFRVHRDGQGRIVTIDAHGSTK